MKTALMTAMAVAVGLSASLPALAFPKAYDGVVVVLDLSATDRGMADGPSRAVHTDTGEAVILLARRGRGGDDGPGDDHGGRGRGSDDAPGDDRGGSGVGSTDDNGTVNTSGRRKPRIPGGSGCDDAGDVAEHPECR